MRWALASRIVFAVLAVGFFVLATGVGFYDREAQKLGGDQATITVQIRQINQQCGWLLCYLCLTVWVGLGLLGLHLFGGPALRNLVAILKG